MLCCCAVSHRHAQILTFHNTLSHHVALPFCCKFRRKNRACPWQEQRVEFIETNLDSLGKNLLVSGFTFQQLSAIYVCCLLFYNFFYKECNPAVYKQSEALGYPFDSVMLLCMALAIVAKFASIVFFALSLDDY